MTDRSGYARREEEPEKDQHREREIERSEMGVFFIHRLKRTKLVKINK